MIVSQSPRTLRVSVPGIGAAAVLCGLLLVITAGLLINVQHAVIGQVILGERVLALLGFALAIAGVLFGGRVRLTPLAALAFLVPIWGVIALITQEVWSSTNTWQARTVAYLIPFATLGLVALAPYAPRRNRMATWVLGGLIALLVGMGLAQWITQTPIVWVGEKGGWYPWVWRAQDPTTGLLSVRAFSYFYTPVQYGVFCAAVGLTAVAAWRIPPVALPRPRLRIRTTVRLPRLRIRPVQPHLLIGLIGLLGVYASANRTALAGAAVAVLVVIAAKLRPAIVRYVPALLTALYVILCGTLVFADGLSDLIGSLNTGGDALFQSKNLLIRLSDYPMLLRELTAQNDQLVTGARDLEALLTPAGARPDLADFVPVDNEGLFLTLQFGLPGLLLALACLYWLAREGAQAWLRRQSPFGLGLLSLVAVWAVGACVNVVYIYLLPIACVLLLLSRPRRA